MPKLLVNLHIFKTARCIKHSTLVDFSVWYFIEVLTLGEQRPHMILLRIIPPIVVAEHSGAGCQRRHRLQFGLYRYT